jgi:hypothetical protein
MDLTRRHALAGAAGIAAAPLLANTPASAAAVPLADKQAPSFYRYKVGDIQVTAVSDGATTFPLADSFVSNAKRDEINAALDKAFQPKDKVTIYFAPLVINTGSRLVVLDTGNGRLRSRRARAPSANSPPTWRPRASIPRRSIPS